MSKGKKEPIQFPGVSEEEAEKPFTPYATEDGPEEGNMPEVAGLIVDSQPELGDFADEIAAALEGDDESGYGGQMQISDLVAAYGAEHLRAEQLQMENIRLTNRVNTLRATMKKLASTK